MLQENDGYFACLPKGKYRNLQALHTNPGKIPDLKAEQDEKSQNGCCYSWIPDPEQG
jgi:hypothetical protein